MQFSILKTSRLIVLISCFSCTFAFANYTNLNEFGDNPGELSASYYPATMNSDNLVVLLHGCAQNGEKLALTSGFIGLAKAQNFSLVIPQQSEKNNIKSCFNWFSPQDTAKDSGEILSIKNIIIAVAAETKSVNIYVIGLSAGGAMASALLVHYPDLFVAGAVVAGLPFPCADNLIKAIACMRSGPASSVDELVQAVTSLSGSRNHWPSLSVWTAKDDPIVNAKNSHYLALQWAKLNGITHAPSRKIMPNHTQSQWINKQKQVVVELMELDTLGHGIAVNSRLENGGSPAPFVIESSLTTALNIITFWQLKDK